MHCFSYYIVKAKKKKKTIYPYTLFFEITYYIHIHGLNYVGKNIDIKVHKYGILMYLYKYTFEFFKKKIHIWIGGKFGKIYLGVCLMYLPMLNALLLHQFLKYKYRK